MTVPQCADNTDASTRTHRIIDQNLVTSWGFTNETKATKSDQFSNMKKALLYLKISPAKLWLQLHSILTQFFKNRKQQSICLDLYCSTIEDSTTVAEYNRHQIKSLSLPPSGYKNSNNQKYYTADIIIKEVKKLYEIWWSPN